jgi:two-component system LytT family sensor kinase
MCEAVESWLSTWAKMLFMNRYNALHLRSYWKFQIVGWGCFYLSDLLGSIPNLLGSHDSLREETVPVFFMFLGSCALHPVCRWLLRQSKSWIAFELKAAAGAVVAAILSACATGLSLQGFHNVYWFGLAPIAMWSSFVLFMWCSLYFSIKQWQQLTEEKQRLLRAETEVREARLLALRYQLNPHFLFNSLEAVSTLILDGKAFAATEMLAQIGDLLRSSLDSEIKTEVALSQEIQFTEMYLAIEQTRLGERLTFELTVPDETRDALVPSMLLQPLVENAVRYGVAPLVEGGWIGISSVLESDRLRIVIGNSGRRREGEQRKNGNGVGLGNTVERLKTLYGANHKFLLEWPESGGCQVTVELPFRRSEDREEAAPCAH